jgi:integrase
MPRPRSAKNRGLPAGWQQHHGAYYYRVPPALRTEWDGRSRFFLGRTLPEAYRTWATRVELRAKATTITHLLDRYALEVVPTKAPATQRDNLRAIVRLKNVFGHMPIRQFEPTHAYGYRDRRAKIAPTAANRELEVMSHAFTKAIEWGLRGDHPMTESKFRKQPMAPRNRYVEPWELAEIRAMKRPNEMLMAFINLKLLTGRRRSELLKLRMTDLLDEGISFSLGKQRQTGQKSIIVTWTPALHEAVDMAKKARPLDISPWMFCTREGECYVKDDGQASGFDSIWQRFMARVLKETGITERFHEHDLRATAGTDVTLEHAQKLLAHSNPATTKRIYRRKPERVEPTR